MIQRIVGLVVTVVGVLFALVIGFWALLCLVAVGAGAAIVYAFRSRGWERARKKHRRDVIEGEFTVVDEKEPGSGRARSEHSDQPPAPR